MDQEIIIESTPPQALAVIDQGPELRLGEMRMTSYAEILNKAAEVSVQLANIIKTRKLCVKIGNKEHVYVEGWTTCGAMLGVAIRPVSCDENSTVEGEFVAVVEAIRTNDGFVLGRGIASCGPDERDWKGRSRQARRSMAQTRAAGKAMRLLFSWVMEMAGFATTPFEEMELHNPPADNPPANPDAPKAQPRGKRTAKPDETFAVTKEQMGHLAAFWKSKNPDPDGNLARQRTKLADWLVEVSGRELWNPANPAEWRLDDYIAGCRALNIETEGVE